MDFLGSLLPQDDSPEFRALIEQSRDHLATLTQSHQNIWKFGEEERWDLDQEDGTLIFTFSDGVTVSCPAQIIGTFDSDESTWMWSWANSSIAPELIRDAQEMRAYGEEHEIDRLTQSKWPAKEDHAWSMAALACYLLEAQGAYRGSAGSILVFMIFGEVQISRHEVT